MLKLCEDIRDAANLNACIQEILLSSVMDDCFRILSTLNDEFNTIHERLSEDNWVKEQSRHFRSQFGTIEVELWQQNSLMKKILEELSNFVLISRSDSRKLYKKTINILRHIKTTTARSETLFQRYMSTMSIIESQKAIAEAEGVAKLTSLAFFFIPLTFIAGIFGMNIVVRLSRAWQGYMTKSKYT